MQEFIGKKLILKVRRKKFQLGDKIVEVCEYKIFDPEMQNKLEMLSPKIRYFLPGDVGTCDYQNDRINFYIDKNGIIFKIDRG